MVKQKIVIKVSMPTEKSRAKAMTLVSGASGVISMGVTGGDKDHLEVIGEDVDAVSLVSCLRKKFGHVEILLVEEVKDKKPEEKKKEDKKDDKKAEEKKPSCPGYPYYCDCHPIRPPTMMVVREDDPASSCSIM
ncbi:hypothetical protein PR202_gb15333 [Eleusine coracana subsp. coracana]|uniref:Metal ion binding protein n=1 Tax=Eleusine coracana subsp. coracana TaxID=191504 RepID=A0AAV5EXP6_ELECO|nr:hypothetical protein QOZ80_4BG0345280 [Eleusine coracana subsp. coracana]GJN27319.1 hypothetical protein PR202_gb15333 [Eleusine coracana subsp. coracana]